MNRRLGGREKSLNDPVKDEGGTEWQDWLVDTTIDQEVALAHSQEIKERKEKIKCLKEVLLDGQKLKQVRPKIKKIQFPNGTLRLPIIMFPHYQPME